MKKNAFTIIEVLIVITIIALLALAAISSINPIEQLNKGFDTITLSTAEDVLGASNRYLAVHETLPWENEIITTNLVETRILTSLQKLVTTAELKESFISTHKKSLEKIYITKKSDESKISLCFLPKSKMYKNHNNSLFNQDGSLNFECINEKNGCYFCVGDSTIDELIEDETADLSTDEVSCEPYDPDYPNFGITFNYSDKWSEYRCDHHVTFDRGCDSYCPTGQRHIEKKFGGWNDPSFLCMQNYEKLTEHYCVSDPYARCDIQTWRGRDSDYEWGCTNPRRPVRWIEK